MEIVLYSAQDSNSSRRVEWVLNYKALIYRRVEVDVSANNSSYLAINPFGYVPSLSIDGFVVCESMAIIEYLEECFPDRLLIGRCPKERAQVRQVCEFVNATIHTPQNRTVLAFLRPELEEEQKRRLRAEWVVQCLNKLRPSLCVDSGYAVATYFTIADIFVACMYTKARQHGAEPIAFYERHLSKLRSDSQVASAEPQPRI
ncbi:glutathione S-transferase family protein [Vibrio sp. JPW-9-11-11]|uniref:glutathione S-transferase family protein n=1 Tax=Vibrio sp. JPW-9-11-11 TaxID=1416532 RepID=UPI001594CAD8|nr:glutathione S-transferase N-terminal domain-containing protein [Vibrio sp. JPW-9-11-11]NVD07696.1 glutathione S-transferase family protein [Vibrio sp. JPW-9-11-11]